MRAGTHTPRVKLRLSHTTNAVGSLQARIHRSKQQHSGWVRKGRFVTERWIGEANQSLPKRRREERNRRHQTRLCGLGLPEETYRRTISLDIRFVRTRLDREQRPVAPKITFTSSEMASDQRSPAQPRRAIRRRSSSRSGWGRQVRRTRAHDGRKNDIGPLACRAAEALLDSFQHQADGVTADPDPSATSSLTAAFNSRLVHRRCSGPGTRARASALIHWRTIGGGEASEWCVAERSRLWGCGCGSSSQTTVSAKSVDRSSGAVSACLPVIDVFGHSRGRNGPYGFAATRAWGRGCAFSLNVSDRPPKGAAGLSCLGHRPSMYLRCPVW